MTIEIPTDLNPELVPLSWLIGQWAGVGRLEYAQEPQHEFYQTITFTSNGAPYLEYRAESYLVDEQGQQTRPLHTELGFWQIERDQKDTDAGVGMLPSSETPTIGSAEEVDKLRVKTADGQDAGFPLTVNITQPGGIDETYVGTINGPQIQLSTDAVIRSKGAKDYASATRMYGLVQGDLMWAWDIAANGRELENHAAARLQKVQA